MPPARGHPCAPCRDDAFKRVVSDGPWSPSKECLKPFAKLNSEGKPTDMTRDEGGWRRDRVRGYACCARRVVARFSRRVGWALLGIPPPYTHGMVRRPGRGHTQLLPSSERGPRCPAAACGVGVSWSWFPTAGQNCLIFFKLEARTFAAQPAG